MEAHQKILIAVLDWGLGHATRCIPIIRQLQQEGKEVILASDGAAMYLLRAEFPHLPVEELPSYQIQYKSPNMVLNIARQMPRILWAIQAERKVVAQLVRQYGITQIISDNRYGCYHPDTENIFLTHQLHLIIPNRALQWVTNAVLQKVLTRFDEIWVPDLSGADNLAGKLAHPPLRKPLVRYIGMLSRMQVPEEIDEQEYDVAIVLSGPEPQRSILEQRLTEQAITLPYYNFIIVQGRPKQKYHHFVSENVEIVSYLTSKEINAVLLRSGVIVCRSGYSSIMDLAVLGKKAILIPTPGQTEQEYLAEMLMTNGKYYCQKQDDLDLGAALKAVMGH